MHDPTAIKFMLDHIRAPNPKRQNDLNNRFAVSRKPSLSAKVFHETASLPRISKKAVFKP